MSYVDCPNCTNHTAWTSESGKTRCIPCGYGITPRLGPLLGKEDSKRAAAFLSGKTTKFERTGR
jgi:hypothetical protein